ncbi:MAG: DUF1566 domain-containing protein, partial [Pricia sp.]
TKKASSKRKALLLLLMGTVAIVGLWIFSEFSSDADESSPFYQNNEATDIEDSDSTPESNATDGQTNTEDTGITPETDTVSENQAAIDDTDVTFDANTSSENQVNREDSNATQTPQAENQETPSSNLEIGSVLDEGIIFKTDVSGNTGTIAYATDLEPMTWENAMKIDDQLGEGWRLPTMEELSEMYATIGPGANNSGQFVEELYWSNEAYDENQARLVRFSDGDTSFHYNKIAEHRKFNVRPVRDFSQK